MILNGLDQEKKAILEVASKMCLAAKTAPKAVGTDKVRSLILTDEDKNQLCDKLQSLGEEHSIPFFVRDSKNIRECECLVLIGVLDNPLSLGENPLLSFDNPQLKTGEYNPTYNMVDLGIALGSATSIAADNRVDNRIMYSIGRAAIESKLFGDKVKVCFGIPLSASSKNTFFDRK